MVLCSSICFLLAFIHPSLKEPFSPFLHLMKAVLHRFHLFTKLGQSFRGSFLERFLLDIYLLVPCMYHASDVMSCQSKQSHAHSNSSVMFDLQPNVFFSTSMIASRKVIICRPLDLLPSIHPQCALTVEFLFAKRGLGKRIVFF